MYYDWCGINDGFTLFLPFQNLIWLRAIDRNGDNFELKAKKKQENEKKKHANTLQNLSNVCMCVEHKQINLSTIGKT